MLRGIAIGLFVAPVLHLLSYRRRMQRTRSAEAARQPVGSEGIVPGAESITLHASETHAALVIHGFGDTPQSVRLLSDHLHREHGWTVRAPLLPGHGRGMADFDRHGSNAWRDMVRREHAALRSRYQTVVLVGLSMGGALATIEAAAHSDLKALVLLAPYLTPPASAERLAPVAGVINLMVPYLAGGDRSRSIFDPVARSQTLGIAAAPPKRVRDLVSVAHDARFAAAAVRAPTLLMHSRTDYRIPLVLAERHAALFTAAEPCEQRWLDGCGHVITVDYRRDEVWAATAAWLARHAGAPGTATLTTG